jgi:hypothetical protein
LSCFAGEIRPLRLSVSGSHPFSLAIHYHLFIRLKETWLSNKNDKLP